VIYDLLVKASGPLELREDPDAGPCVAGLRRIEVRRAGRGPRPAGSQGKTRSPELALNLQLFKFRTVRP
jgi:hypothetical protein